jgi:hypothetical protein
MTMLNVFALTAEEAKAFREAGHSIEFVKCDTVYAAVERVEARPVLSEAALRAQHDVVAQIAGRVDAVLPARFGSVVDVEELTRVVTLRRDAIQEALELVRGRDQMTVRLFIPEPATGDVCEARSAQRRGVPSAPTKPMSGAAYLQERRIAASPALPPAAASIAAAVRGLVVAERVEPGQGRVTATLYHLVDRAAMGPYTKAHETLQLRLGRETLIVSGPWPPFAFVPDLWL